MARIRSRLSPYAVYQCLCSVGFLLMVAHTQQYQELHWPEGRVVYVHPWLVFIGYATGAVALFLGLWGARTAKIIGHLNLLMPRAAAALLAIMVLMALFFPGPYAP